MDVPAGVTQEESHTGFVHLPSAVLASVGGELQRLHFRNTMHAVFSRQYPRGNRGRVQRTRSLGRAIKYIRLKDVNHQM